MSNLFAEFGEEYDQMINWSKRLAKEAPFYRQLFARTQAKRILDLGCGTGRHALLFAGWGLEVVAADPAESMITQARENAAAAGVPVTLLVEGFGEFRQKVTGKFDVVLVLGNSLPHLLSAEEVRRCLDDISAILNPGGVVVIQNRNYSSPEAQTKRFMPLNSWEGPNETRLFLRFMDFYPERVDLNIITLTGQGSEWDYRVVTNSLRPMSQLELDTLLSEARFTDRQYYGNYDLEPFSLTSPDLLAVACKQR